MKINRPKIMSVYKSAGTTRNILIDISMPYPTYSEMGDAELSGRVKAQGRKIAEILLCNIPVPVFEEIMTNIQYFVEHNEFPLK